MPDAPRLVAFARRVVARRPGRCGSRTARRMMSRGQPRVFDVAQPHTRLDAVVCGGHGRSRCSLLRRASSNRLVRSPQSSTGLVSGLVGASESHTGTAHLSQVRQTAVGSKRSADDLSWLPSAATSSGIRTVLLADPASPATTSKLSPRRRRIIRPRAPIADASPASTQNHSSPEVISPADAPGERSRGGAPRQRG